MNLLTLLALVDIKECDNDYCQLIIKRADAMAAHKNCELDELTLRDVITCIETAGNEFSPAIERHESPTYASTNTRTLVIPGINPDDLYKDLDLSWLLRGTQS